MHTTVVLLRGINVGGKNKLPMKDLREVLASLQLEDVRTYIQSGNAVVQSQRKPTANLPGKIAATIEATHGFSPAVMVLTSEQLAQAIDHNPYPEAAEAPTTVHLFFLAKPAKHADLDALKSACAASERFELTDGVFYLHAPNGIARSKVAASAEKHLGVATTARNWRTVVKLKELTESLDP